MNNVITFERFKVMKNPSFNEIRRFVVDSGWKDWVAHWDRWLTHDEVVLERLPEGKHD